MKISARLEIDGKEYSSDIEEISESSGSNYNLYINYEPPISNEEVLEKVDKLIENYEIGLINAVNYGSYNYLENYIEFGSPFMKSQKKLISNLYDKETKEELLSYKVENVDIISEELIYVTVSESHMISYKSGEKKEVNNKWTYTLVNKDEELLIREIKKAE